MRVIVCGGRGWGSGRQVRDELNELLERRPVVIVHGACPTGADYYAGHWARATGQREEPHPADWGRYGNAAGPKRNRDMADLGADLCIAFWDGKSRGTAHMIRCARDAGIPVRIVAPETAPHDPGAFA